MVLERHLKCGLFPALRIVEALNAEGIDFYAGYTPLNQYPTYQHQIAFRDKGCPFMCPWYQGNQIIPWRVFLTLDMP